MKKLALALALALTLTGTLTACGRTDTMNTNSRTGSTMTGQVSQRSVNPSGKAWDYLDDARYTAGSNGKVYGNDGNPITRDLTQGARDIVRGTENAMDDLGRGVGDAARDVGNGMNNAMNNMDSDMTNQAKTY